MPKEKTISDQLENVAKLQQKLAVRGEILLGKALHSENPTDIIKAQTIITREKGNRKSYIVDPLEFQRNFGFKERNMPLSYNLLRAMARTPIISAIIRTRINQIASFAQPQEDRFSTGYIIRKKRVPGMEEADKLSKDEEKEAFRIMEFIENGGVTGGWETKDFDAFTREVIRDSLTFDQMTWENVRNRKFELHEIFSVDASTIRRAQSFDDDTYRPKIMGKTLPPIKGYRPNYVQIYQNEVRQEFYPWELCFGVRNPTTNIYNHGYGISELEELISTITALLWGEEYNRRFFKQGSAPKGLFKISGNLNPAKLAEFRQQWNATMRGVYNAWKTPILEADKAEYIDLQKSNRDMEFSNWIEFLIKVACAVWTIDPEEVNFSSKGGGGKGGFSFEGNNEARLKHSKDKGLRPLLKFYQRKLNKHIITPLNPAFELVFMGINAMTPKEEMEADMQQVKTYKTVNEIREKRGMKPIKNGDIILDPTFAQAQQAAMFGEGGAEGEPEESVVEEFIAEDEETAKAANPFELALNSYLDKLNPN